MESPDVPDLDFSDEFDSDTPDAPDSDGDDPAPPDVDLESTPDVDVELDFEVEDNTCPTEMCWAECIDDLDTDSTCFNRIVLPFWCSTGTCCLSVQVPCGEIEPPEEIDWEFDDLELDTPDADELPDSIDSDFSCSVNLTLDVGNDSRTPWEWQYTGYETSERIWTGTDLNTVAGEINSILRHGCDKKDCAGCFSENDSCFIPFVYRSNRSLGGGPYGAGSPCPGCLSVDDINFSYWLAETIESVPYGRRLRFSCGGLWDIRFNFSHGIVEAETFAIPPDADCPDLWYDNFYTNNTPPSGLDAYDAIDDAMYRLLDEKLDVNPKDGVVEQLDLDHDGLADTYFTTNQMWFETTDKLGIQTMWGPEAFRLVVWVQ